MKTIYLPVINQLLFEYLQYSNNIDLFYTFKNISEIPALCVYWTRACNISINKTQSPTLMELVLQWGRHNTQQT